MTPRAAPAPRIDAARPAAIERWLPGVGALRTYRRAWLPQDLMAGLVLSALLVPQGMAYAELAGLPAIYGLYTTVVGLLETSDRRHFFPTLEVAAAAVERAGLDVEPPREVPEPA